MDKIGIQLLIISYILFHFDLILISQNYLKLKIKSQKQKEKAKETDVVILETLLIIKEKKITEHKKIVATKIKLAGIRTQL